MASNDMPPAFGERRRVYNQAERAVIDIYKSQYMQTTTPGERKALAQGKIFPDLFTYWSEKGVDLNASEMNVRSDVSTF